jgi:hypothetical protein
VPALQLKASNFGNLLDGAIELMRGEVAIAILQVVPRELKVLLDHVANQ